MIFTGNPKIPLKHGLVALPLTARMTIRIDEAARRRIADTDGTLRRARQLAEDHRLI